MSATSPAVTDEQEPVRERPIRHLPSCEIARTQRGDDGVCSCLTLPELVAALRYRVSHDEIGERILDDLEALAIAAIVESLSLTDAFGMALTDLLGGNPSTFAERFMSQSWGVEETVFGSGPEVEDSVPYRASELRGAELVLEVHEQNAGLVEHQWETVALCREWLAKAEAGTLGETRRRAEAEYMASREERKRTDRQATVERQRRHG